MRETEDTLHQDADDDEFDVEGHYPLIPDGVYSAKYLHHTTAFMFGRVPKVFLHFEIVEGEYQGVELVRPFRAASLKSRPGRRGKFGVKANGDLFRMVVAATGTKQRADRFSLLRLREMVLRVTTRTVTRNRDREELVGASLYSVVGKFEDGS